MKLLLTPHFGFFNDQLLKNFLCLLSSGINMLGEQRNPRFVGLIDPQCAVSEVIQGQFDITNLFE